MALLLYGENTFLIKEKVDLLKKKFQKEDSSGLNLIELDGATLSGENFVGCVFSVPFLHTEKLIVIKNLILENTDSETQKYIKERLVKIPASSKVIFAEFGQPDLRKALFKALNKPKLAYNFRALAGSDLNSWIDEKVSREGLNIPLAATQKLAEFVGSDLWHMEQEIIKLALLLKSEGRDQITLLDIENNVKALVSPNIFNFIDFVAGGNRKKAFVALKDLIDSGENEIKVLSMIVYQYRNMLTLMDLKERGNTEQVIGSKVKMHPFVLRKTLNLLKSYKKDKLKSAYFLLQETDKNIKSGKLASRLAVDVLVAKLCV